MENFCKSLHNPILLYVLRKVVDFMIPLVIYYTWTFDYCCYLSEMNLTIVQSATESRKLEKLLG